ncbi:MAG: esterase-like activity of phytase family protein, partial [Verrucomicrobiae bacterium]|nr:esterase-like activity of phytase family protein [Verrucomicrobiae bacterium]
FAVAVDGLPIESIATGIGNGRGSSAPFGLAPLEDVSDDNGSQLFAETVANNPLGVTKFMRPEDGHWNPLNPNEFYFVTTGRFGAPGRLFRLAFHDIKNPEAGGIITVVLDGTEGMVNPDNLVVDHLGNILIQEDPGGNSRLSKIWRYRPGADVLEIIAEHNPLYFDPSGDLFMTTNEEASGIIDLKSIVGPGWYLADVQAHASNADPELVENGQLVAIYAPIEQMEGPSTKTGPYVVPSIASVDTTSVLTVGDSIGGYRMAGIPDGLGALDNKDGTFSLFVHHELGETVGVERAHGGIGAFISKWVITTHHHACGPLQVLEGSDLIQTVMIYNPVSGEYEAADPAYTFNRFCSADLAGPGAFYWNGLGTQYRIFTGGEENDGFFGGDYGRAFATFVNGPDEGTTYDLPWMGKLAFENVVPSPYPQLHTIVAGLDDSASSNNDTLGEIYFYVGVKTDEGSEFEKSGLKGGDLFAVAVEGLAIEDIENGIGNGAGSSLPFTLAALPDVSADDGSGLFDLTVAENELGITKFLRPEDGAWDPNNPNCFYFVTTGRFGAPGRLFKLTFDNIETPEAGGAITLVLDGTEGIVNADNITVDRNSNVLIQEDPGGSSRLARIWFYDAHTGELTDIAQHDPKFFDPDSEFLITTNEEASGIIDVSHILGEGLYLISDQVHANSDDPELVEGGQIALVKVPYTPPAVPELRLNVVGTYETGIFDEGASEIVDYDPMTQRGFIVNAQAGVIDVLDLSDPSNPTLIAQVTQPGSVNSVAVKNGIVVTAVQNDDGTQPGWLVFHDTDGNVLSQVTAGVLPDNVVFSPDGLKVLSANEGEPLSDYSVDPEGSVTIVDLGDGSIASVSALTDDDVIQVTFEAYNDRLYSLLNKGIRIFGPGSTVAQDLEPEYITVIDNLAYVTLQENNAFAVINCDTGAVLDILPLGYKDHSSGQPELHNFTFEDQDLPVLGLSTKDDETPILLGGFSGLWYAADESSHETKVFYTIPDRGPNGDAFTVDGVTSREFLLPDYQARIVRVELNEWTGALAVTDQILLTREDGGPVPIHGLPNIPGWDEVPLNGKSEAVDYDPYGGDMEGIVRHPDGTFWTVDEYRPAIYHFSADGSLIERYVPEGTSLLGDTPMPEGTYGAETLPAEYAKRWSNRGFEAVALDPEKDVVYAFIQSPMHNPDNSTQNKSDIIRVLGINAADGTPVEEYIYLLERNAGSGYSFARTDKIGDAVYAGKGRFYVIERDSSTPDDPGYGHKYIFEMDINPATNLLADGAPEPMDGLTWEQHSAEDLNAQGVRPVWKRKVLNLP